MTGKKLQKFEIKVDGENTLFTVNAFDICEAFEYLEQHYHNLDVELKYEKVEYIKKVNKNV